MRTSAIAVLSLAALACHVRPHTAGPDTPRTPATEVVPPGEAAAITEIEKMLVGHVRETYEGKAPARRDAHVKAHGCVMADVTIHANLPDNLARGVFAEPKTYPAWIRFSSSADRPQRDRKPDGRGMAIKLMGVPGAKLLPGHEDETTQDFVLINYPVFVVEDAADYIEFTQDSLRHRPLHFFFHGGRGRLPELDSAEHLALQKVRSPLQPDYFSMTPYLLGDGQAVKYGARPCASNRTEGKRCGPDFLQWNLTDGLVEDPACFELMVQVQTDPANMPIEDPTVEWDPKVSPYVPVADVYIPAQRFDSEDQMAMCEQMSFNPWHTRPEHRPLGGINRVRKVVYAAISALRHELDGIAVVEPRSHDVQEYLRRIGVATTASRDEAGHE